MSEPAFWEYDPKIHEVAEKSWRQDHAGHSILDGDGFLVCETCQEALATEEHEEYIHSKVKRLYQEMKFEVFNDPRLFQGAREPL